jgi:methyl acetate hydrolase
METQEIDGLLEQAVQSGAVPGVVAMAAGPDGVVYEGAAGALSVDGGADVKTDTVFWMASMTKAVTSAAALQLVESGRLGLEQRVTDVRPEFGNLQVLDGFDGDEPRFRPPAGAATIRQLLTHTGGPGYWITNPDIARFHEVKGVPAVISGQMESLVGVPLADDPGTVWEYGTNTDWLGLCVETISGRPLNEYLREFVLEPLGMSETGFEPSDALRERTMKVHARTPDGGLTPLDFELPREPDWWPGGHGLYGPAGDYLRFTRALLGGGELEGGRILSPETVELMFTNQIGDIVPPAVIPTGAPELTNDIAYPEGPRYGWGCGLHLTLDDVPGMRRAGTGDWGGLANSYYWIDRTAGLTGVVFTQLLPFFDERVLELAVGFEQAVYAEAGVTA